MTPLWTKALVATATALAPLSALAHGAGHCGPTNVPTSTELKQFGGISAGEDGATGAEVPLWDNLSALHVPITTRNPLAQRYFDQGMLLALGFNHGEARRSFQQAQTLDPGCALCHWGEALVLGPNINAPMDPESNAPALAALARAKALRAGASPKEQALVDALAARYSADPGADRKVLDDRYADAMAAVAQRFPEDDTIAALFAEALMDLTPWDYWTDGGKTPTGRTAEIVATLERVLARNPDHPGAIHLYIHAVEASDRPERAEPHADRLAGMNLGAGHLVHMPSHIYYRVGRYGDSLEANRRAVAADEAFFAKVKPTGIYGGGYYPHNIHFLMVSAQMAGDRVTAIDAAAKLARAVPDDAVARFAWLQPIKAAPMFAYAQFGAPGSVLSLPKPSGGFPLVDATWHYARGVALAAQGDRSGAAREAEAIAAIAGDRDLSGLTAGGVPAPDILEIAREVVLARIAQSAGDAPAAIAHWRRAKAVEDGLSYMEPPYWYYPIGQSLGAALFRSGDLAGAEAAFQDSLGKVPNNGWALFGLAEARRA